MSNNVLVVSEFNVNAGQLDNLKALIGEMTDALKRDEPGALNYEWFISADGKCVHVYERYADSEAFMGCIWGFYFRSTLSGCLPTGPQLR